MSKNCRRFMRGWPIGPPPTITPGKKRARSLTVLRKRLSARLPCAGNARHGALDRNAQTGLKLGFVTDEDRISHSAPFPSDHFVDVDPAPNVNTGLESGEKRKQTIKQ